MTTDTGLQPLIVGINIAAPSIAVIFVLLRLYSRQFITRNLGWDDSLIVTPMVLAIAMAVTGHMGEICLCKLHVKLWRRLELAMKSY